MRAFGKLAMQRLGTNQAFRACEPRRTFVDLAESPGTQFLALWHSSKQMTPEN
jgi:hypothetical protein